MRALMVGLWCASAAAFAGAGSIGPPTEGHFAKDLTGRISAGTLSELDALARGLDASGQGQLGVLVVRSTGGQVPRTFATQVFNSWGIGHASRNDGVLLFVALDDRKAEIIIGDGLRGRLPQSATDTVMRDNVVSNFKAGRPDQALIDAAHALIVLLAGQPRAEVVPTTAAEQKVNDLFATGELPDPSPRGWVIDLTGALPADALHRLEEVPNELYVTDAHPLFVLVSRAPARVRDVGQRAAQRLWVKHPKAAVLAVDTFSSSAALVLPPDLASDPRAGELGYSVEALAGRAPEWNAVQQATVELRPVLLKGWPARSPDEVVGELATRHKTPLMGFGVALLFGGGLWGRRWNRYRSRSCADCHRPRQLLGVGREDAHLSQGQKTEQSVGSVDYDVWWCGACRTVLILDNTAWFSGYGRCGSCGHRTSRSTTTTIEYATEWSGGSERIDSTCASCGNTSSYTRSTARLSSSNSSDWSSSSGSSSSSDSSFGGGSSSGGGSSGSW